MYKRQRLSNLAVGNEREEFDRLLKKALDYVIAIAAPMSMGLVIMAPTSVSYTHLDVYKRQLEVLNTEVLQWLEKTGNGQIHGTTRLVPAEEFEIERKYLLPYLSLIHIYFPIRRWWLRIKRYWISYSLCLSLIWPILML